MLVETPVCEYEFWGLGWGGPPVKGGDVALEGPYTPGPGPGLVWLL